MTSVKVKFLPSATEPREGTVHYQLTKGTDKRLIPSGHMAMVSEWKRGRLLSSVPCTDSNKSAEAKRHLISSDLRLLGAIIARFNTSKPRYSLEEVEDEFSNAKAERSLFHFMDSLIGNFRHNERMRTSETYLAARNSFRRFLTSRGTGKDIPLDSITGALMEEYETWLRRSGVIPNTVSFYMRVLRATYNRAVDIDLVTDARPFRHVYTGVDKTVKRALAIGTVRKIRHLELIPSSVEDFARDMFMLSFYLRGMSFIDMSFLRRTDLRNGYLSYRRRKTGQLLTIKWTAEMQQIVDKYPQRSPKYLLPIISQNVHNERCAYRNAAYNINRTLKKIATMVGAGIPLTMYVARHTWASIARYKGVPIRVISEGLGHDSESTTQIYLSTLDSTAVDKANSLIISLI